MYFPTRRLKNWWNGKMGKARDMSLVRLLSEVSSSASSKEREPPFSLSTKELYREDILEIFHLKESTAKEEELDWAVDPKKKGRLPAALSKWHIRAAQATQRKQPANSSLLTEYYFRWFDDNFPPSELDVKGTRGKAKCLLDRAAREDRKLFIRAADSDQDCYKDFFKILYETKLTYKVRYDHQTRALHGVADMTVWWGDPRKLGTNLAIHHVWPGDNWETRVNECLAYLAMGREVRKRAGHQNTAMYGMCTDGYRWIFLKIHSDGRVSFSPDLKYSRVPEAEEILAHTRRILEEATKMKPPQPRGRRSRFMNKLKDKILKPEDLVSPWDCGDPAVLQEPEEMRYRWF
ncbi:hypothetical protein ASPZODRAFT_166894 [Penicilliopsis zonata CBS 506.65]|uniref:Uncharacterized protein n=1 Tax=Penicilliopsis zonata CBS 506.65 TaxID=1073090 RepID=A0A1L9SHI1_9EURO|nr:hypothetical protein ASPZODRAFT_166894 [Penicilliopsis zonata CBS 506.65]OJJ46680.1 hypothetical protein ASPZODRAFT_166894 [Penicilliopsis zonata CBS 506.65]